ncbi:Centaurin-gamma-1A, variant 3 [Chamberlinius hualienensis]
MPFLTLTVRRRSLLPKKSRAEIWWRRKSDSFVNSQEWTLSRSVPDLRLGIVGNLSSGKSALVHRYLTGSYMQEESPEGGRFKKEIIMDGQSYLLLIRDEGGPPESQFTAWVDAVIFVFSLENESSFNAIYSYYAKMAHFRNTTEIPLILVGTQDAISENNPRVIDDARARKLAIDLKRCSYYETCATYGLNVERVFQDACQKIVQHRMATLTPSLRPSTPNSQTVRPANYFVTSTASTNTSTVASPSQSICNNGFTSLTHHHHHHHSQSNNNNISSSSTLSSSFASSASIASTITGNSATTATSGLALTTNTTSSTPLTFSNATLSTSLISQPPPPHRHQAVTSNNQSRQQIPLIKEQLTKESMKEMKPLEKLVIPDRPLPSILNSGTWSSSGGIVNEALSGSSVGSGVGSSSNSSLGTTVSMVTPIDKQHSPPVVVVGSSFDSLQPISSKEPKDSKDLPTPSSTPTTSRKARRRSNLFTPSKKGDDSKKLKNGEMGSGRAIPLKQGYLYKRSCNALNKEWKKKYVTLCEDGRLTYHPSLNDYMDDVHGKEIPLMHITVKIPGQKPRGSKSQLTPTVSNVNGLERELSSLSIGGGNFPFNFSGLGKDKSRDKDPQLTTYEVLRDGQSMRSLGGYDDAVIIQNSGVVNGMENSGSGISTKIETPNVKKRHRRMKSSGAKNLDNVDDSDGYEFIIVSLDNKQWHFDAANIEERDSWVQAIEQQILSSLQNNESSKSKSRMNSLVDAVAIQAIRTNVNGNSHCVDCDSPNPDWASLNLGVLMCIECSGIHRNLGSHISRVRSLDLDEWPPWHIKVMMSIGNHMANSIWEGVTRGLAKPTPHSSREEKERWIRAKYERKEFLLPLTNNLPIVQQLIDSICKLDVRTVVLLLAHAISEQINSTISSRDLRTPLHLASASSSLAVTQLLIWHNANVKAVDHDNRTVLVYARNSGVPEMQELLLQSGCPEFVLPHTDTLPRRRGSISRNNPDVFDKLPASVI